MALSDNEVTLELKKMVAFIKQEALEKSSEIQTKANEEFTQEKAKIVLSETSSIDAFYERKHKQAELSQQILRSNVTNKTRLKVLAAQQDVLDHVFEQARKKLYEIANDEGKYTEICKNLILEGLYCLNEKEVLVRAREKDWDVVRKAIPQAEQSYKETVGTEVKVQIEEDDPLPEESAGGIIIIGFHGKIEVDNTLEERLRIMESEALPAVRISLFGPAPNRKFYD